MNKKTMWIGGAGIALVALLVGGGVAYAVTDGFDDDDDDRGTSQSNQQQGGSDSNADNRDDDDYYDDNDADDAPITDAERESAENAALAEAGGGTVTGLERSDDKDHAWEVEVTLDGRDIDIELDEKFVVTRVDQD